MKCEQCQNWFDELQDGTLSQAYEAAVMSHIEQCDECREQYDREQMFRAEMAKMPVPAMRSTFPDEVMAKVKHRQDRIPRRAFVAGFGSAVAASIALWFVLIQFAPQGADTSMLHAISLSVGQVQQVNLVFNSPEHLEQATFTLSLPASAELDGYPGKRELTWTASLHKGKNRLLLPLRLNAEQPGEIVARISHGKQEKVFRLRLDVKSQHTDSFRYQQV